MWCLRIWCLIITCLPNTVTCITIMDVDKTIIIIKHHILKHHILELPKSVGERLKWVTLEGVEMTTSRNCCSAHSTKPCVLARASGMFPEVVVLT